MTNNKGERKHQRRDFQHLSGQVKVSSDGLHGPRMDQGTPAIISGIKSRQGREDVLTVVAWRPKVLFIQNDSCLSVRLLKMWSAGYNYTNINYRTANPKTMDG